MSASRTTRAIVLAAVISMVATGTVGAAAQPQISINPDRILKGTTPTITITLNKSVPNLTEIKKLRVAGQDISLNVPTGDTVNVLLPKIEITGQADVEIIGKDDKPVAAGLLTYVAPSEGPPVFSSWVVVLYVALIFMLAFIPTLYDIKQSYRERRDSLKELLGKAMAGRSPNLDEIRALIAGLDTGPTGLVGLTRGLTALTILLVLGFAVFHLVVFAQKIPDIAEKLLTLLAGALTSITGFYFGAKAATEGAQQGQARSATGPTAESAPTIAHVEPQEAASGTDVTITGQGFGNAKGAIRFGSEPAEIKGLDWSDTAIKAKVPANLKGKVTIQVTTTANARSNEYPFVVKETPAGSGGVKDTGPKNATGVVKATIPSTGSKDTGGSKAVGDPQEPKASDVTNIEDLEDTDDLEDTGGSKDIGGDISKPSTAPEPAPTIDHVEPKNAPSDQDVTIFGQGFGNDRGTVRFGSEPAEIKDSNWKDTAIKVKVPANLKEKVTIQVTTTANVSSNEYPFATKETPSGSGAV